MAAITREESHLEGDWEESRGTEKEMEQREREGIRKREEHIKLKTEVFETFLGAGGLLITCALPCVIPSLFLKFRLCLKKIWFFYAWVRVTGQITLLCWWEFSSELWGLIFKHQRRQGALIAIRQTSFSVILAERGERSLLQNYGALDPHIIMHYFEWTGRWLLSAMGKLSTNWAT